MSKEKAVRYYQSFTQDFVESKNQNYTLPEDYQWIRTDFRSRFRSAAIYGLAIAFSTVYCRLCLHVRFVNRKILKNTRKTGAVVYSNHTQPVGDVFDPALACFPNRIYTLVSPANLGIPFLGKILPYLGALPLAGTLSGMKELNKAVALRLAQKKCVVIYPEAHVWEYYTEIRPFPSSSFKFPVKCQTPAYAMTVTYQKRRLGKKPKAVIYLDGPFYPDAALPPKAAEKRLRDTVFACMKERSQNSNCQYIRYEKTDEIK